MLSRPAQLKPPLPSELKGPRRQQRDLTLTIPSTSPDVHRAAQIDCGRSRSLSPESMFSSRSIAGTTPSPETCKAEPPTRGILVARIGGASRAAASRWSASPDLWRHALSSSAWSVRHLTEGTVSPW